MNIPALSHGGAALGSPLGHTASSPVGSSAFGDTLKDLLGNAAASSAKADQAVQALAEGRADGLHTVSLAVAQADLNFRLILELRNRVTEAYQEVMRMQV